MLRVGTSDKSCKYNTVEMREDKLLLYIKLEDCRKWPRVTLGNLCGLVSQGVSLTQKHNEGIFYCFSTMIKTLK